MKKMLSMMLLSSLLLSEAAYAEQKIAIVDIQAVVDKSAQVQALKKDQQTKLQNLEKWLTTVQADVQKQQTQEGREKLLKKYNTEFAKKKEALTKDYQAKLIAIDKSITGTIASQAKSKGYDMVISKSVILYGGDDITVDVQAVVK